LQSYRRGIAGDRRECGVGSAPSEAAKVVSTKERASAIQLALIIGNGHYPDAAEPLHQSINDASGLSDAMRRHGFDVDLVEDATKADMVRAVERLKSRIEPGSVVMLFFGGYGVQSRHETYLIPTDAVISFNMTRAMSSPWTCLRALTIPATVFGSRIPASPVGPKKV